MCATHWNGEAFIIPPTKAADTFCCLFLVLFCSGGDGTQGFKHTEQA
jgi:hypothetical protein